ncbi:MAG TPA: response regulator [Geminicoccaceae bacterium]|nr:response regulator [Geminicoccus sp.]HMU49716.1 response regulator [Geminicoccaceae bacterium]
MIVLIVEDEPFTAMALEMELQGAGHRVLGPAATVGEAEALIVDASPDVALVDINLQGGGDSVALSRRLMAQGTKVLFTSGQTATARANRDAAWGLITKPYDPRTVLLSLEVVQNLADGRPPERMPMRLELFAPAEGRPVTATER